jgi:DNA-binding CsgD family transcriptional regulator/GAF domain-containing protein
MARAGSPWRGVSLMDIDRLCTAAARERRDAREVCAVVSTELRAAIDEAFEEAAAVLLTGRVGPNEIRCYQRVLDERRAISVHDDEIRTLVTTRLATALSDLREAPSSSALLKGAPRALCDACGFTRAMVSAVQGSRWVPLMLFTSDQLDPQAEAFQAFVGSETEIPLANMLAETDMARRRAAIHVEDAPLDPRTFKPIIEVAQSPGYVAAPIVIGGRATGFMHADRVGQRRTVSYDDMERIAEFAAELASLFDRAVGAEQLLTQRVELLQAMDSARAALAAVERSLPGLGEGAGLGPTDGESGRGRPAPSRDALLTPREREVLECVAQGATNAATARQLKLSEDTVKTHLRAILRKLHVTSRGAAVAQYIRLREN